MSYAIDTARVMHSTKCVWENTHVSMGSAILDDKYATAYNNPSGPTSHTVIISKKTLDERGEPVATSPYAPCNYEGCKQWDFPEFDNRVVVAFTDPLVPKTEFGVGATVWTKYKNGKNSSFLCDLFVYRESESTFCSYFTLTPEEIEQNDNHKAVTFRFDCKVFMLEM